MTLESCGGPVAQVRIHPASQYTGIVQLDQPEYSIHPPTSLKNPVWRIYPDRPYLNAVLPMLLAYPLVS